MDCESNTTTATNETAHDEPEKATEKPITETTTQTYPPLKHKHKIDTPHPLVNRFSATDHRSLPPSPQILYSAATTPSPLSPATTTGPLSFLSTEQRLFPVTDPHDHSLLPVAEVFSVPSEGQSQGQGQGQVPEAVENREGYSVTTKLAQGRREQRDADEHSETDMELCASPFLERDLRINTSVQRVEGTEGTDGSVVNCTEGHGGTLRSKTSDESISNLTTTTVTSTTKVVDVVPAPTTTTWTQCISRETTTTTTMTTSATGTGTGTASTTTRTVTDVISERPVSAPTLRNPPFATPAPFSTPNSPPGNGSTPPRRTSGYLSPSPHPYFDSDNAMIVDGEDKVPPRTISHANRPILRSKSPASVGGSPSSSSSVQGSAHLRSVTRRSSLLPKTKSVSRILSLLDDEARPFDGEVARERHTNEAIKNDSGAKMDTSEASSEHQTPIAGYLQSKLNPEMDLAMLYKRESTPSPSPSMSGNLSSPGSPALWPVASRGKRKASDERFDSYYTLKRRAVSPGFLPTTASTTASATGNTSAASSATPNSASPSSAFGPQTPASASASATPPAYSGGAGATGIFGPAAAAGTGGTGGNAASRAAQARAFATANGGKNLVNMQGASGFFAKMSLE